jgi:large subunit ribosomal protein L32
MATVPKVRKSRSRTRSRRANWKAESIQLQICPNCKLPKRSHIACPSCGVYKKNVFSKAERKEYNK